LIKQKVKNILKETYKTLDIIEPEFNKDGSLKNKRCLKCNRKTRGFAKDNTNWGARLHYCVACHIEMKNNKQSDKLLDREKPSKSRPEFNNYGHLISKICTKCEVRKIANEFSKRPQGIGEKTSWCKACTRKNLENWQTAVTWNSCLWGKNWIIYMRAMQPETQLKHLWVVV